MNRHKAIWFSVLCLGLITSGVGIGQQVNWARHPNLAAAQRMTQGAMDKITAAQQANEFDMGGQDLETNIAEIDDTGTIYNQWNMATIIRDYMTSHGDDASAFVRPGQDWFHTNSAAYDPSDDSLIVSSRENFVIKVGYSTGNIIWILGDTTKYWYTFPSLRAKALTLTAGLPPIGQHGIKDIQRSLLVGGQRADGAGQWATGVGRRFERRQAFAGRM